METWQWCLHHRREYRVEYTFPLTKILECHRNRWICHNRIIISIQIKGILNSWHPSSITNRWMFHNNSKGNSWMETCMEVLCQSEQAPSAVLLDSHSRGLSRYRCLRTHNFLCNQACIINITWEDILHKASFNLRQDFRTTSTTHLILDKIPPLPTHRWHR